MAWYLLAVMLKMKSNCESCEVPVEPTSSDVYICSYECTWCRTCAEVKFELVCPNCGGNLVQRPTRARSAAREV